MLLGLLNDKNTFGDYLEVNNLQWLGTSDLFPNGSLEIWENVPPIEIPEFWTVRTDNPSELNFAKSADAHEGNFSLQLTNRVWSPSDKNVGIASIGYYRCPNNNGPCDAISGIELTASPHYYYII